PQILPGMIAAAAHPLIHLGYAVEFSSPRVLAEALAFGCCRQLPQTQMVDEPVADVPKGWTPDLGVTDVLERVCNDCEIDRSWRSRDQVMQRMEGLFKAGGNRLATHFNSVSVTQGKLANAGWLALR